MDEKELKIKVTVDDKSLDAHKRKLMEIGQASQAAFAPGQAQSTFTPAGIRGTVLQPSGVLGMGPAYHPYKMAAAQGMGFNQYQNYQNAIMTQGQFNPPGAHLPAFNPYALALANRMTYAQAYQAYGTPSPIRPAAQSGGIFSWNSRLAFGAGVLRAMNPNMGSLGGLGRTLAGAHIGNSFVNALANTNYNLDFDNAASHSGRFAFNVADNLSFGFAGKAWSIGDQMGMFGNVQNRMRELERSRGISASSNAVGAGMFGIRNTGLERMRDIQRGLIGPKAAAIASGEFAAGLSAPGAMDSFVTNLPEFGKTNLETGSARFAAAQGQVGLREAQLAAAGQQELVAQAKQKLDEAQSNVANAQSKYSMAHAGISAVESSGLTGQKKAAAMAEAKKFAEAASGGLENAQADLASKRAQHEKEVEESRKKQTQLAQAQYQADMAVLGVKKNQLDIMRQEVSLGRGGARQLGMMMPGQQDFLLKSAEKLKKQGFASLSPMEREALASNDITSRELGREAEAAGMGLAGRLGELGYSAGTKAGKEKELGDLEKEVMLDEAKIAAALAKSQSEAWEGAGRVMAESVKNGIREMMEAFITKMGTKELTQQTSQAIAGTKT